MNKWMQKLVKQFEVDLPNDKLTEDRATLLYILDAFSKNLIELDTTPIRKAREQFDELGKELLEGDPAKVEKALFRARQFFSSYRVEEYTYLQKCFDDFRNIIWAFVDQLAEDFSDERKEDQLMQERLAELKDAVEANSIGSLKTSARLFIDNYMELQGRRNKRKTKKMDSIKRNLEVVKKKLNDTSELVNIDHLTKAMNRKGFDEAIKKQRGLFEISRKATTLVMVDIDHFKKINDTFGHAIGDFIIQECAGMIKKVFSRPADCIARVGGEEFAAILPETNAAQAMKMCEALLEQIRAEAFVQEEKTIRFTISVGIAQLQSQETAEQWVKRADVALYESKNGGRNRYTVSGLVPVKDDVAS